MSCLQMTLLTAVFFPYYFNNHSNHFKQTGSPDILISVSNGLAGDEYHDCIKLLINTVVLSAIAPLVSLAISVALFIHLMYLTR